MSITAEEKARVMKEYGTKDGDTGSPEVQVAILSLANRDADRAFQNPQERQSWAPRSSEDGRATPQVAGLRQGQGRSALFRPDQTSGSAPLNPELFDFWGHIASVWPFSF